MNRLKPRWGILAAVVVAVIAADQLTKAWAAGPLGYRTIHVFWTLRLRASFNSGLAFSLGGGRGPLIAAVSLAIVAVLLWSERRDTTKLGAVARGLIIGGALGNVSDRLLRTDGGGFLTGRVVDFIDFQWWPVFNVADSAVCVGVVLLAISIIRQPARPKDETVSAEVDAAA